MAARRRRLPAPTCIFCQRSLSEIGGRRITWSSFAGVIVRLHTDPIGSLPSRALVTPLPVPYRGCVLVVWQPVTDALDRAVDQWFSRQRPWTCQACARRVCDRCGSPEKTPFGSDIVDDNGRSLHVPLLPGPAGCVREGCPG